MRERGTCSKHGFGEIAVRIEQRQALAGCKVLANEIEQQRALAGAGLADDVEMPAALLRIEHDNAARVMGADAKLVGLTYS